MTAAIELCLCRVYMMCRPHLESPFIYCTDASEYICCTFRPCHSNLVPAFDPTNVNLQLQFRTDDNLIAVDCMLKNRWEFQLLFW